MTKKEWINIISQRQESYSLELKRMIETDTLKKEIFFNSPTGTGKTRMISLLMDNMDESYFFLITTLSRGGLNEQVEESINTKNPNYLVFGVSQLKKNTLLMPIDIINKLPVDKKIIWIRDEGHIKSNKWMEFLEPRAFKIINVSATNENVDIQCNFYDTPLLRTPYQFYGEPLDAVLKLLEVKKIHSKIKNYNPCLLVRDVNDKYLNIFIELANKYKLTYINITSDDYNMHNLCLNNNEVDIIINKMKIVEGIDIPRASVIFIGNRPNNDSTIIQLIGRARRNALLWFDDIDIFEPRYCKLREETQKTYIFYNKNATKINTNECNEFVMELSNMISIEKLMPSSYYVVDNKLENGYVINELIASDMNYSGLINISKNSDFNVISNLPTIYKRTIKTKREFGYKYREIIRDEELVKISLDKSKYYKFNNKGVWKITTLVRDNVVYGKLHQFISKKYFSEIDMMNIIHIKNTFKLEKSNNIDSKKIGMYKKVIENAIKLSFLSTEIRERFKSMANSICNDSKKNEYNDELLLYEGYLLYCSTQVEFFSSTIECFLPNLEFDELIGMNCEIKKELIGYYYRAIDVLKKYITSDILCPHIGNSKILHGVVDAVTKDTIYFFCWNNYFSAEFIYQMLAMHYLSTKREDLSITRICVYSFISNEIYEVPISSKNSTIKKAKSPEKITFQVYFKKNVNSLNVDEFYEKFGVYETLNYVKELEKKCSSIQNIKKILKHCYNLPLEIKNKICDCFPVNNVLFMYAIDNDINNDRIINAYKDNISHEIIDYCITKCNYSFLKKNLDKIKFTIKDVKKAISTSNNEIIRLVMNNYELKSSDGRLIIATHNILANEIFSKKVKVTTNHICLAIKTRNIELVYLYLKRIDKLSQTVLTIAKKYKMLDVIKDKM